MNEAQRTWTVDSIEEGIAAVEEDGGRILHLPDWLLPDGVKEGDVLTATREESGDGRLVLTVRIDREATERALRRSREQLERLRGRDPGGDIVL